MTFPGWGMSESHWTGCKRVSDERLDYSEWSRLTVHNVFWAALQSFVSKVYDKGLD